MDMDELKTQIYNATFNHELAKEENKDLGINPLKADIAYDPSWLETGNQHALAAIEDIKQIKANLLEIGANKVGEHVISSEKVEINPEFDLAAEKIVERMANGEDVLGEANQNTNIPKNK